MNGYSTAEEYLQYLKPYKRQWAKLATVIHRKMVKDFEVLGKIKPMRKVCEGSTMCDNHIYTHEDKKFICAGCRNNFILEVPKQPKYDGESVTF